MLPSTCIPNATKVKCNAASLFGQYQGLLTLDVEFEGEQGNIIQAVANIQAKLYDMRALRHPTARFPRYGLAQPPNVPT